MNKLLAQTEHQIGYVWSKYTHPTPRINQFKKIVELTTLAGLIDDNNFEVFIEQFLVAQE
ncbi:hypothetical protein QUB75_04525 [Microcoleus sp. K1-B6]|uniref:hypothetical protein n=1 Tax=unclassified Microcoleus TaxID=2642155 RepID=UPI002FD34A02